MDHSWVRLRAGDFRPLLDAGIRLFEYQPSMVHQKLMVVDHLWSVVGTTNLDMLSFEEHGEIRHELVRTGCEIFRTTVITRAALDTTRHLRAWFVSEGGETGPKGIERAPQTGVTTPLFGGARLRYADSVLRLAS